MFNGKFIVFLNEFLLQMSGSQTSVEFNFIVNISSDELNRLDSSEIKDVTFDNINNVKLNLKNRLRKIILESFESMGSVHLEQGSFNPSNSRLSSTHRSIHFGGSSGKRTGIGDYLIRFRLSVVSFVDYNLTTGSDSVDIWKKMKKVLERQEIYVDETRGIKGTIEVDSPSEQSWWSARDISTGEDKGFPNTSEIDKSKDASFEKTMESDSVGLAFGSESEVDEDNPLNDYNPVKDSVSDIHRMYEKYENDSIQVRKPTESEIDEITSVVYQQVEKIIEGDNPVYLNRVPENWKNATCSRCSKSTDSVFLKFEKENMRVIKKRLRKDFGLGSENKFTDSRVTNFFVTKNGQLLIRPEETISWLISIANETRPYCDACNCEVGGDSSHSVFRKTQVKSTKNERKSPPVGSYVNQDSPALNYERLEIDTDDSVGHEWSEYRSPTSNETSKIEESIVRHLWRLGTRSEGKNTQFNSVYDTLFNRDYKQDFSDLGYYECDVCGFPVASSVGEGEMLRNFEKHHIEPAASNRAPIVAQKIQHLIYESENTDAKHSSIKVSKESSRFLFTEEFLSLLEVLYRNVDTIALFCDECDEEVEKKNSIITDAIEEDEETEESELDKKSILDFSYGVESSKPVRFVCLICKKRNAESNSHFANVVSGKCIQSSDETPSNPIPVVSDNYMFEKSSVGLCSRHKREVGNRIEQFDLDGSSREEKLRNLLEQLAYT